MFPNKRFIVGGLFALVILALTACATQVPSGTTQIVQQTVVVPQTAVVRETVIATPAPATGGTFRLAIPSDITDFDPGLTTLVEFQTMKMGGLWNTLYTWDENLQMKPDLAESWEVVDPQTVIFHIRPGVKFHTGRELTAQDVKWTFEWMIKEGKVYARELGSIVGAAEAAKDKSLDVTGIEVLDDHTIQVKLTAPNVPWLSSIYPIPILDKETIADISTKPIGTGPFKFKEWIPNDRVVLERFDDYWEEGKPYLDRVELRVIPNQATAIANLKAGEVDAMLILDASQAATFTGNRDFQVENVPSTDLIMVHTVIDSNPVLQDVHARRALAYCLDKDTINRTVFFGLGQEQWSPIPSSFWAFNPEIDAQGYPFSVEKAKEELAQSKTPDGFDITYTANAGIQASQDVGAIWKSCLDQIGINMNIEVLESAAWLEKWFGYDYQLLYNSGPLPPDPQRGFTTFFTPQVEGTPRYAKVGWKNPAMYELMIKAATTVDQAERQKYYDELQKMTIEEVAPIIYIQQNPTLGVASSKVHGFDSFNSLRLLDWSNLWLDQ